MKMSSLELGHGGSDAEEKCRGEAHVKMESEMAVCICEPRTASCHKELGKARKGAPPEPLEGMQPCLTLDFWSPEF